MRRQVKAPSTEPIEHRRGFRGTVLVALTAAMLCGLFAASAQAATIYRFAGEEFGTPGSHQPGELFSGELSETQGIAVDDQSGLALIPTGKFGFIGVFETNGTSTVQVDEFGQGTNPYALTGQLAIDQAERVVYALDIAGEVLKYDISGSGPLTFTKDTSYESPTVPGSYARIAIDPTTGDLLTASRFGGQVNRYEPDGTFVGSFNGAGSSGGTFSQIYGLAVDPTGSVYVVDVKTSLFYGDARSVVEQFASDGTPDLSFSPEIPIPNTVAVDQSTGNVLVVGRTDGWKEASLHEPPYPVRLYTIHGNQIIDELDFPARNETALASITVGNGANNRVYAGVYNGFGGGRTVSGAYVLEPFIVPNLQIDPVGTVTQFTAQVSGSANPVGQASTYHFEYSREGGPAQNTESIPLGEGEQPVPVSTELTDLIPNSEYQVRLVGTVESSGVSGRTPALHFKTPPAPPQTVTGDAYDLTQTSATVAGKVNPYGQQTSYWFEYGPTADYGLRVPADHGEVVGSGREPAVALGYLKGLQLGTEYHYRLVAASASGTTLGADRTFTTKSLAAPARVYEQVSPVIKGANVNGLRGMNVSPDGSHVMYEWKTAPLGAEASPAFARSAAIRSPSGWSFLPLDPPQIAGSTELVNHPLVQLTLGISEDGTKAVVASLKALAPGAVEGTTNIYLRDTSTGEYTTIGHSEGIYMYLSLTAVGEAMVVDGTPNYSHVLLIPSNEVFTSEPAGPEHGLYDFSEGQLHAVSIAPDETPMSYVEGGSTSANNHRERHYISDDGSKIFFESGGNQHETYVRYNQERTTKISGRFCGASRDGRYAFVTGHDVAHGGGQPGILGQGLYRFDTETEEAELLVPSVGEEGCAVVSPNGQSVYFGTGALLTPDAKGLNHLYVWRNGQVQLVANGGIDNGEYMTSPNGEYFSFGSYESLTGYDNSSTACVEFPSGGTDPRGPNGEGVACPEIFRYDTDTEQLTCASCRRDGGPPTGHPRLGTENVEGNFRFQRSVLDNGMVIFDTTDPLSALDTNSNVDVYTYDGSEQTLISSGFENSRSEFDGASADGRDIFFTTQDQLVGQDKDSLADIYDARIDGGIPGQNPPPPRPECIRDDCKGTPNQGPELPFGGSEALNGPENVHEVSARKPCAKGTHARKAKGKTRCVKAKQKHQAKKQHKKQAKSNRRQGR